MHQKRFSSGTQWWKIRQGCVPVKGASSRNETQSICKNIPWDSVLKFCRQTYQNGLKPIASQPGQLTQPWLLTWHFNFKVKLIDDWWLNDLWFGIWPSRSNSRSSDGASDNVPKLREHKYRNCLNEKLNYLGILYHHDLWPGIWYSVSNSRSKDMVPDIVRAFFKMLSIACCGDPDLYRPIGKFWATGRN